MGKRPELRALPLALALSAVACDGCQKDKPYTPFGVTTAVATGSGSAEAPPADSSKPEPTKFPEALVAPAGSRKLRLGDVTLDAPAKYAFDRALVLGEGESQQAVAWLKADAEARDVPRGILMAYAGGKQRQLMVEPTFVPIAPGCEHATRLTQSGKASVLVDTIATCPPGLMARVPVEAVSIVSPSSERPEVLTLRLAAPAPGEALRVDADSSDRDGDGREDAKLTFTLKSPGGGQASATLAFVDRAAGVSRDAAEPRASLTTLAKSILAKPSASAAAEVDATRRLLATLCAESGTARVFDGEGSALRCEDVGGVVDMLARAEALAHLAAKDTLGAAAVLTRSSWYFKKLSSDAEKSITKELNKRLLAITPTASALTTKPKSVKGTHWSPLWFEADGSLLVVTDTGVTRASRDGLTETPLEANSGTTAWPLDVIDAAGRRLTGATCACDASEIQLALTDASGAVQPAVATQLLSPRPGGCKGSFVCPDPVPVAAGEGGLSLLIAGALSEPKKAAIALPSPGSARSPDGSWLVAKSSLGLIVSGASQELWQLPEAPLDARHAQDCVIRSDRTAVACISDGKVILLKRP